MYRHRHYSVPHPSGEPTYKSRDAPVGRSTKISARRSSEKPLQKKLPAKKLPAKKPPLKKKSSVTFTPPPIIKDKNPWLDNIQKFLVTSPYVKPAIALFVFLLFVGILIGMLLYFLLPGDPEPVTCNLGENPDHHQILKCEKLLNGITCSFDTTKCSSGCDLGFVRNDYGCVASCDCANKGTLQGDVAFSPINIQSILAVYNTEEDSSLILGGHSLLKNTWDFPKMAGRTRIPYIISNLFEEDVSPLVDSAIEMFSQKTCVDFVPRLSHPDYLEFTPVGRGCRSYVGKQGGQQAVVLGDGCRHIGAVLHQLMHAIGFWHEESRPDRDDFVSIKLKNVAPDDHYNFKKLGRTYLDDLNTTYDKGSVMQSDGWSYAKDSWPSIVDKESLMGIKSQSTELSREDVKRVNQLYQCDLSITAVEFDDNWAQWSFWYPCSVTCGEGKSSRYRECLDQTNAKVPPQRCPGPPYELRECKEAACAKGAWGQWSGCTVSCGTGRRHRESCCFPNQNYQVSVCRLTPCKAKLGSESMTYEWSTWSSWQPCSRACGGGSMRRARYCVDYYYSRTNSSLCPRTVPATSQSKSCATRSCNVTDGSSFWDLWGSWSECSSSCGQGTMTREQKCLGAGKCVGSSSESKSCKTPCPAIGWWGEWQPWGECPDSCTGHRSRHRMCMFHHNQITTTCEGAGNTNGRQTQYKECVLETCEKLFSPDKGRSAQEDRSGWTVWTAWGRCSVTCREGYQWRLRRCNNRDHVGCQGRSSEVKPCTVSDCGIPQARDYADFTRGWGPWKEWEECSVTCGDGYKWRIRECLDHMTECPGRTTELSHCNTHMCGRMVEPKGREASSMFDSSNFFHLHSATVCRTGHIYLGDFNGDQRPDTICHLADGTMSVWLGTKYFRFSEHPDYVMSTSFCLGGHGFVYDLENDEKDEILCHQDTTMRAFILGSAKGEEVNREVALPKCDAHLNSLSPGRFDANDEADFLCSPNVRNQGSQVILNPEV